MFRKLSWYWIFFGVIFLFFVITRFTNLDKHLVFNWDQETFSTSVKELVQDKDIKLLGPRANNDRGFFLGPYFTYLLVPFYIATDLHPSAILYFVIAYNLLFFGLGTFLITKIFGRLHALFFMAFWAANYLLVQFDSIPWWPLVLPLGVILVWWCLYNLVQKGDARWYAWLGLTLGFFMNFQAQFIFMGLYAGLFLLFSENKKQIFALKKVSALIGSFAIMFLPLLAFDLKNNFINWNLFVEFFAPGGGLMVGKDPWVWINVVMNVFKPFTYVANPYTMWTMIILFTGVALFLSKKHKGFYRQFYLSFALVFVISLLTFIAMGKRPTEYYYVFLYPFFIMTIVDLFLSFNKPKVLAVLLLVFAGLNFTTIKNWITTYDQLGLEMKDKVVFVLKENLNISKNFNISYDIPLGHNSGFNYLVNWYGIKQSGEWQRDPLVQIRLPEQAGDIRIGPFGIYIPQEVKRQ